jgi:hypothetical protein
MCRYAHVQEAMQENHPEAAKRKSSSEAKPAMNDWLQSPHNNGDSELSLQHTVASFCLG